MNLTKILGLLAVGGLLVVAAPNQPAQAASLINPGVAATVQDSTTMKTDVQYRRHRHWHPRRHWHRHHWRPHHRHHHRHWR
jgi:hypothetical protein